jgi:hypothetical protein
VWYVIDNYFFYNKVLSFFFSYYLLLNNHLIKIYGESISSFFYLLFGC